MDAVRWDYRLARFGNVEIGRLQQELGAYGQAGWELVGLTTTVQKFGVANDLIAVFKRPGIGEVDTTADPQPENNEGWI